MSRARASISDNWRVWTPSCAAAIVAIAATISPLPLVPIARGYQELCARYPVLALLTNHLPPLPTAFLAVLIASAFAHGATTGLIALSRTRRFIGRHSQQSGDVPDRLTRLCAQLRIEDRILYLDQPFVAAFCFGMVRPRIAVSAGLLARVDDEELLAVLAHEHLHLMRRDPLRYVLLHAAAASTSMFPMANYLRRRIETRIEVRADRAALAICSPGALAGAMLAVVTHGEMSVFGSASLSPTEARIAHLVGQPIVPEIPRSAVAASMGMLILIALATVDLTGAAHLVRMVCIFCGGQS